VLDQLKRNPQSCAHSRHVGVSRRLLAVKHSAMGAVGYAMKPVKREQLAEALQRLEKRKFSQASACCSSVEEPIPVYAGKHWPAPGERRRS